MWVISLSHSWPIVAQALVKQLARPKVLKVNTGCKLGCNKAVMALDVNRFQLENWHLSVGSYSYKLSGLGKAYFFF